MQRLSTDEILAMYADGCRDFRSYRLQNQSMPEAKLTGCDFSCSDLSGVDFSGAMLDRCNFWGVNMNYTCMTRASVKSSNFQNSTLLGASINFSDMAAVTGNGFEIKSAAIDFLPLVYTYTFVQIGSARESLRACQAGNASSCFSQYDISTYMQWLKYRPLIQQLIKLSPAIPPVRAQL